MRSSLIEYRQDIDGLRAIAVLSVILYHLFPDVVKGGFIGVDIFFVISGFLITKIIFKSISDHKFNFFVFYARRIKRIFPALIIVLIVFSIYGYFVLFPDEFNSLNKHSSAASVFLSNLALYKDVGYFDFASDQKPFLHLWSLSVEEQFYLGWPFFIWGIYRAFKSIRVVSYFMFIVTLGSYLFYLFLYQKNLSLSFYFPLTRLWELSSGSCIACFDINEENKKKLNILSENIKNITPKILYYLKTLFFLLLFLCLVFLDAKFLTFKYMIIVPIISVCIIIFYSKDYLFYRFLSHPLLLRDPLKISLVLGSNS